jgi:hypothetical protein
MTEHFYFQTHQPSELATILYSGITSVWYHHACDLLFGGEMGEHENILGEACIHYHLGGNVCHPGKHCLKQTHHQQQCFF